MEGICHNCVSYLLPKEESRFLPHLVQGVMDWKVFVIRGFHQQTYKERGYGRYLSQGRSISVTRKVLAIRTIPSSYTERSERVVCCKDFPVFSKKRGVHCMEGVCCKGVSPVTRRGEL